VILYVYSKCEDSNVKGEAWDRRSVKEEEIVRSLVGVCNKERKVPQSSIKPTTPPIDCKDVTLRMKTGPDRIGERDIWRLSASQNRTPTRNCD